jgi:hypothetical protein
MRHALRKNERRGSPGNGRGIPRKNKECGTTVRIQQQEQMFTGKK